MTSTKQLITVLAFLLHAAVAFPFPTPVNAKQRSYQGVLYSHPKDEQGDLSRRSLVTGMAAVGLMAVFPAPAEAKPDCMTDCVKNCKQVVPNDTSNYCRDSCLDYCTQPDRRDGLSGSVSSEGGEVGILGGTFGQGTVVRGEDKPPIINLPGLNFNSKEGKKLLGL